MHHDITPNMINIFIIIRYYLIAKVQIQIQNILLQQVFIKSKMMSRVKPTPRKSSISSVNSKQKIVTKNQLTSDSAYLLQNENEILKLKNQQLASRIAALNIEVKQRQYRITEKQQKCQQIRQSISKSIFVKDIELENQKNLLQDKLMLGKQKVKNLQYKINDIRKQTVIEEEKIPILVEERKKLQQELRIAKMENQGLKTVIINLEQQNEQFRKNNNQLSLKKSSKKPQQKAFSQEIQDRIRIIKNLNAKDKVFKKQQSLRLLIKILQNLFFQRKKICFLTTQKYGLKKSLIKKKFFLLTLIRKKYINFVKSGVISTLRQLLNPLQQEQKCVRILENMRKRREKAKIWRIWRNETAEAEYSLIRKFQSQTVIQKIGKTVQKRLIIVAFERLRYFKNDYRIQIAVSKMFTVLSKAKSQPLRQFFSILSRANHQYQIQQDIETSAQNQSRTLILSRIFYGWQAMMKDKKKESLTLKFKYFNELKKIFIIKKRNVLNEMLGETKIRLNEINVKSICFAALKKQIRYQVKEKRTIEERERLMKNFTSLQKDTENRVIIDEQIDKQRALTKIQKYLKRKAKQALTIWRKQNKRVYAVQRIYSLISFYSKKSVNYSFSRIQTRRFQKLKVSIRDKIDSCDYSYNYLVEENNHIKQVLDKKSHQLEKTKFVTIIRRLVRQQKEIKQKYFYKFLKNGQKFWMVKKSLQNIDSLMKKKLSLVFMFLLKLNKTELLQLQKIQKFTQKKDNQIINYLLSNSFKALKFCVQRNKRMRRALMGVFDRNTELNSYQAYGKIRDQSFQIEINRMQEHRTDLEQQINQTNQNIETTIQTIEILTERLKTKQEIFKERKVMSIYKFFARNVKKNIGEYIWKWKNKVEEEKRIMNFVKTLERKTESIVKTKLFSVIQKTKQELHKKYLQNKLEKYTDEYEHRNENFEKFLSTTEQQIAAMEVENEKNDQIIIEYQKKTDHINDVKVESFLRRWVKNICKFAFREWKKQKVAFVKSWQRVFNILMIVSVRDPFKTLSTEIRSTLVRDRIRKNLIKATSKAYRQNIGLCFKLWRNINIKTKVKQSQQILKLAMTEKEHIEQRFENLKEKYNNEVNKRINQWKLRRLTNVWRIYTEKKLNNNKKYEKLMKWLQVGYSAEIVGLFKRYKNKSLSEKNTIANFKQQVINKRAKIFLQYLYKVRLSKHTIERLFINKFCYHEIHQLNQQFFTRTKNYQRFNEIKQKDYKTYCIQKVIDAFQKKRKGILSQNMRMWKRNMYLMNIQKNLLRRLVRKAMNNRVKDLFYAWKAETSARNMVIEHTEEGQVKKRKIQIQRLKKYISDFKKEKGLLLENEEGDFVISPKYQEKKEKELKRSNLLKYKFVSRLILSMNGYEAPVKAWTNLQMFTKLRVKIQKCSLMVRNRMQKGDLYTAFKTWHNDTKQVRRQFEEMQRKDLIRLLNRQKDRMQIQYGKKVDIEQKVQKQLRRYKLLSYQDKRKQRIFAQILFRQARKVKSFAFDTWRERAKELVDFELNDLEQRGNNKLLVMDEQVQDLERYYRDLEENNRMLKAAVQEALELADMIKRISQERDQLQRELAQSDISCQSLQAQNQQLNNKLILAQKQAMNLLTLSNNRI